MRECIFRLRFSIGENENLLIPDHFLWLIQYDKEQIENMVIADSQLILSSCTGNVVISLLALLVFLFATYQN